MDSYKPLIKNINQGSFQSLSTNQFVTIKEPNIASNAKHEPNINLVRKKSIGEFFL